VTDFPFSDDDRIAICVEGAGVQVGAAADGLLAFPGIPDAVPQIVTVANEDGLGGSVEFAERGYQSIRAGDQTIGDCPGERAEQGTGLLLAVRLLP
jgi:nitrogen fixation protein